MLEPGRLSLQCGSQEALILQGVQSVKEYRYTLRFNAALRNGNILVPWVSFSTHAYYFGFLALTKSVILGRVLVLPGKIRKPVSTRISKSKQPQSYSFEVLRKSNFLFCFGIGDH